MQRIGLIISFSILFLVSALRVNVGTDYASYKEWFSNLKRIPFTYVNIGFNSIIIIIKLFTQHSQWFFVITSFLILSIVYFAVVNIQKEEYDMSLFLFIALGFYFSTFNGIRQWIAIAIFMYSYRYIIEKNFKMYFLLILIASTFHITAILLFPFYFLFQLKLKDKMQILFLFTAFLVFKIFNFDSILAFFLKKFAISFYWRYFSSGVNLLQGVGSPFPILLCTGMFAYYLVFKRKFLTIMEKEKYEQHKNLCFILSIFSITNTVNNLFSRFSLYFIPMIIFLLPDFYSIFDKKWIKPFKFLIICVGISFLIINTLLKNSNNPLPYNSILGAFFQ